MSIAPGKLNLTFPQGATWNLSMTYTDSAGDPLNLTDYEARMQARLTYDATEPIISINETSGITLGGTAGTIRILVDADTASNVDATNYVYDLEIESPSGEVTRVIEGSLTVTPEVTR